MTAATIVVVPPRSIEQRLDALQRANRIRSARAELKRDITDRGAARGATLVASILEAACEPNGTVSYLDPHGIGRRLVLDVELVDTMKVYDLILVIRGCGHVKVRKLLNALNVSPSKTVGGLTNRQRLELVSMLRAFGR